ncbi:unnamed protein product [Amoebophrya sp. A25]|nr:unnamed protein product [Amoebophrya sp. A25]|eukprot:GSA25T00026575001.1
MQATARKSESASSRPSSPGMRRSSASGPVRGGKGAPRLPKPVVDIFQPPRLTPILISHGDLIEKTAPLYVQIQDPDEVETDHRARRPPDGKKGLVVDEGDHQVAKTSEVEKADEKTASGAGAEGLNSSPVAPPPGGQYGPFADVLRGRAEVIAEDVCAHWLRPELLHESKPTPETAAPAPSPAPKSTDSTKPDEVSANETASKPAANTASPATPGAGTGPPTAPGQQPSSEPSVASVTMIFNGEARLKERLFGARYGAPLLVKIARELIRTAGDLHVRLQAVFAPVSAAGKHFAPVPRIPAGGLGSAAGPALGEGAQEQNADPSSGGVSVSVEDSASALSPSIGGRGSGSGESSIVFDLLDDIGYSLGKSGIELDPAEFEPSSGHRRAVAKSLPMSRPHDRLFLNPAGRTSRVCTSRASAMLSGSMGGNGSALDGSTASVGGAGAGDFDLLDFFQRIEWARATVTGATPFGEECMEDIDEEAVKHEDDGDDEDMMLNTRSNGADKSSIHKEAATQRALEELRKSLGHTTLVPENKCEDDGALMAIGGVAEAAGGNVIMSSSNMPLGTTFYYFRVGARLVTVIDMIPDSLRGFAYESANTTLFQMQHYMLYGPLADQTPRASALAALQDPAACSPPGSGTAEQGALVALPNSLGSNGIVATPAKTNSGLRGLMSAVSALGSKDVVARIESSEGYASPPAPAPKETKASGGRASVARLGSARPSTAGRASAASKVASAGKNLPPPVETKTALFFLANGGVDREEDYINGFSSGAFGGGSVDNNLNGSTRTAFLPDGELLLSDTSAPDTQQMMLRNGYRNGYNTLEYARAVIDSQNLHRVGGSGITQVSWFGTALNAMVANMLQALASCGLIVAPSGPDVLGLGAVATAPDIFIVEELGDDIIADRSPTALAAREHALTLEQHIKPALQRLESVLSGGKFYDSGSKKALLWEDVRGTTSFQMSEGARLLLSLKRVKTALDRYRSVKTAPVAADVSGRGLPTTVSDASRVSVESSVLQQHVEHQKAKSVAVTQLAEEVGYVLRLLTGCRSDFVTEGIERAARIKSLFVHSTSAQKTLEASEQRLSQALEEEQSETAKLRSELERSQGELEASNQQCRTLEAKIKALEEERRDIRKLVAERERAVEALIEKAHGKI